MIELGANFRLSGAPDYLVTLALLFIAGLALHRGLSRIPTPQVDPKLGGAVINPALKTAWWLIGLIPGILMSIAALALVAATLPTALEMIGL